MGGLLSILVVPFAVAMAVGGAPISQSSARRPPRRRALLRDPSDVDPARPSGSETRQPMSPPDHGSSSGTTVESILEEHGAAVFRLAKSVVRDDALADDVTQETFIKVWKHLGDFRGESSLRSWVLRIAHNQAVSTLRRVKDSATDPSKLPEHSESISTSRVVEGRLAADHLRTALADFDDLTREILVLREVEGMSYDEIAEALDVPVPTVKTRLLRARRRLTIVLEGWRS